MSMEYGEAITEQAAEQAFDIALQLRASGVTDERKAATAAVARAYCACVTDGEDAAEHRLSNIHANLIDSLAQRLRIHAAEKEEQKSWRFPARHLARRST